MRAAVRKESVDRKRPRWLPPLAAFIGIAVTAAAGNWQLDRAHEKERARQEYERPRDVMYEGLCSIPGLVDGKPQGAFYMSVRLPVKDAERFVIWMLTDFALDKETVMVAPGQGFYSTPGKGLDEIRIAYVLNESDLKRALVIFKAGLEKYKATIEA